MQIVSAPSALRQSQSSPRGYDKLHVSVYDDTCTLASKLQNLKSIKLYTTFRQELTYCRSVHTNHEQLFVALEMTQDCPRDRRMHEQ